MALFYLVAVAVATLFSLCNPYGMNLELNFRLKTVITDHSRLSANFSVTNDFAT